LGTKAARELPYASTLCGACAEVCPIKIPIPKILRHLRKRIAEGDEESRASMPKPIQAGANVVSAALAASWVYRIGSKLAPWAMGWMSRDGWIKNGPYPLNRWTKVRPLPAITGTFRDWWKRRGKGGKDE